MEVDCKGSLEVSPTSLNVDFIQRLRTPVSSVAVSLESKNHLSYQGLGLSPPHSSLSSHSSSLSSQSQESLSSLSLIPSSSSSSFSMPSPSSHISSSPLPTCRHPSSCPSSPLLASTSSHSVSKLPSIFSVSHHLRPPPPSPDAVSYSRSRRRTLPVCARSFEPPPARRVRSASFSTLHQTPMLPSKYLSPSARSFSSLLSQHKKQTRWWYEPVELHSADEQENGIFSSWQCKLCNDPQVNCCSECSSTAEYLPEEQICTANNYQADSSYARENASSTYGIASRGINNQEMACERHDLPVVTLDSTEDDAGEMCPEIHMFGTLTYSEKAPPDQRSLGASFNSWLGLDVNTVNEWTCAACSCLNSITNQTCQICGFTNSRSFTWSSVCQVCTLDNHMDASHCNACCHSLTNSIPTADEEIHGDTAARLSIRDYDQLDLGDNFMKRFEFSLDEYLRHRGVRMRRQSLFGRLRRRLVKQKDRIVRCFFSCCTACRGRC